MKEMNSNQVGALTLAFVGDAVYELKMRIRFLDHDKTVQHVRAEAQAEALDKILPLLDDQELAAYKRGRNAKVNSVPSHASMEQYHKATGLEALFGWLYMNDNKARIDELFDRITEDD